MEKISDGSYVVIIYRDRKYLKKVKKGDLFSGKGGNIPYDEIIGRDFGIKYGEYLIFKPTIEDVVMLGIKRETQIVYPKDGFYICMKLNLKNGSKLLEIGTGSGALTLLFSRACGPNGKVVSLEKEERHYKNAKRNLETYCELKNVALILGDVTNCREKEFDACFVDVREPWSLMQYVRESLKPSGIFGTIIPTTNQISDTLKGLQDGFGDIEVMEILLRKYKTLPERVRPFDRMVAHTGYLVFARKVKE
ncbi:MAG: tRNA (adenine-N1)-methyltransferase [Deltaproteobacteria bacterium]|nr:tRNA (adenine-N1)-methyltransferase [Deltaproteobacteria bacterium]